MRAYGNVIQLDFRTDTDERRATTHTREGRRARRAERQQAQRDLRFAVEHIELISEGGAA